MSGKIKKAEEFVYAAVRAGEMEIDQNGQIWRIARRRGLKTGGTTSSPCKRHRAERRLGDYLNVRAMVDGKRMTALAHRIVWFHVNGSIPDTLTINHKNGKKTDNRPTNLELATDSEQMLHATHVLHKGRAANQNGMKNHATKLTTAQVEEIRLARTSGEKLATIAMRYGVTFQHISVVARGLSRSAG